MRNRQEGLRVAVQASALKPPPLRPKKSSRAVTTLQLRICPETAGCVVCVDFVSGERKYETRKRRRETVSKVAMIGKAD